MTFGTNASTLWRTRKKYERREATSAIGGETRAPAALHLSMEANVESFQATTITGVRYVVPEQLSSHTIADTDAVPANATDEATAQLIRQAEDGSFVMGDDFYLRYSAHFTYNGNGDLTASFSDMTMECR